ncbi:transposase [Micromonospora pisi]|uniref:transposase n=1 Tax=Micromonospora pisi TaxID=589240 RepID=UPI001B885F02|nr:transposase [Micromonospora pisi]
MIHQLFGVDYTLRGVSYLLHRIGYTVQVPARRPVERDPEQIAGWRRRRWPAVLAAGAECVDLLPGRGGSDPATAESQDVGQAWAYSGGRGGVSGKGSGRVSIAGLVCLKPGERGRFVWRTITHRGRKGERSSFSETDYANLLDQVHQRLRAPIILVWDNLDTHVSAAVRALIAARNWLTVIRLPAYAPDLNPTEGAWAHLKRGLADERSTRFGDRVSVSG